MTNTEGDLVVEKVMEVRDSKGDPVEEPDPDYNFYANLIEEDLAKGFEKLSPTDKIHYNEWFDLRYQKNTGMVGSISQLILEEIPKKEFEQVDFDPDQVQIERIVDKDGKEIKCVKPTLIKKEIEEEYATHIPFELGPDEDVFLFTDEERVSLADKPYKSKSEEETDDDDYIEDDIPIEIESDSSAALSMTDDNFEATDPGKIDQALQEITKGLF